MNKQDLEKYLNTTINNSKVDMIIDAVNAWVESYVGRSLTLKTATEEYDYDRVIFLDNMDIRDVEFVKVNGRDVDYTFTEIGRLTIFSGGGKNSRVSVRYTYGMENTPADLLLAMCQLASENYLNEGTNMAAMNASVGSYSLSFGSQTTSGEGSKIKGDYMDVFNVYKKRNI